MINFFAIVYMAIFSAFVLKASERPYLEGATFQHVSILEMSVAFIVVFCVGVISLFLKNKFSRNSVLNKKWNERDKKYKLYLIIFGLLVFITYLVFIFAEIFVFK